jgi:hypothetical protein
VELTEREKLIKIKEDELSRREQALSNNSA